MIFARVLSAVFVVVLNVEGLQQQHSTGVAHPRFRAPGAKCVQKYDHEFHTRLNDLSDILEPFINAEPAPHRTGKAKVAFLMIVTHQVYNSAIWKAWLHEAESSGLSFKFLIHTGLHQQEKFHPDLSKYLVEDKIDTKFCNVWHAQQLLLEQALADPDVTHMMMLSDSTVPVKSLRFIHQELERQPESRFCSDNNWWIPRAETWWVLRRGDASLFYEHRSVLRLFNYRRSWDYADCVDENMWYWPMSLRMKRWGSSAAIRENCTTYTEWQLGNTDNCKEWENHADPSFVKLREGSHYDANVIHPATFSTVSPEAARELLRSPFWFARKFEDGAFTQQAAFALLEGWRDGELHSIA